jgi:excinuclease UvrABC nuclease subunit
LCKGWCNASQCQENYKQFLQLFISFFKGNTDPVEKTLLQEIENAVQKQHFEWATKLRDIYYHIEQFVEKQHVELPKNISGYVLEIRQI